MALRPLSGKPRPRRLAVYDLEWIPGNPTKAKLHGFEPLQLRLIGYYDGQRYEHFHDIRSFLNHCCRAENDGMWFYAHNGGRSDLIFLLEYVVDNPRAGVTVQCAMVSGSAVIVKITKGRNKWFFIDSLFLLPSSLAKLAPMAGVKKLEGDFYGPLSELIEYNRRDCELLYKAIRFFEKTVNGVGGQLQKTIASTALDLFRRVFLSEEIATDESVNAIARQAYFSSRVEVFETSCDHADYYDVNSSFPYAMTFPAPGNLARIGRHYKEGDIALVKATINVPDMVIPPLPFRNQEDNRVYFPCGRWRGWFSSVDIDFAEECGAKIDRVEEVRVFEPFTGCKRYAETIYEHKLQAKKAKDEGQELVWKILLNSLYGKFGEGSLKSKVLINPPPDFFKIPEREPGGLGREMLMPGVHELVENKDIPHAHVPISVHITAIARKVLTQYMRDSRRVYYCDTDGFAVDEVTYYPTSDKLGGLKHEKHVYEAVYLAPKLYAYRESEDGTWKIRAKGFSRPKDANGDNRSVNYDDFRKLIEHKDIALDQFARLKTLWRSGDVKPREYEVNKTWQGTVRTKRRMLPQGGSEPWHVSELQVA